jgi:hypothetical protein
MAKIKYGQHLIKAPFQLNRGGTGLMHCPMEYKRVGKPILHLDIYFASKYERIPASR